VNSRSRRIARIRPGIQNIANTQPGYQVDVRDGVVHIWPSGLIPDRENFLKLRIPAFDVNDAYVEVASFKLHMLITPRNYGAISIGATGDSKSRCTDRTLTL
jgi:hypothetical protein